MPRAEIIAVGSELLLGGRLDTNSLFLTDRLADLGIEVRFKSVVGDELDEIAEVLRAACRRADVVLLTGGLGPTQDDLTRLAIARVVGVPLRRHPLAFQQMHRRLAAWGRSPSSAQLRQIWVPAGAQVMENPIGSAPGFALRWNTVLIAALPGVPREAEQMFASSVTPWLLARVSADQARLRFVRRLVHTFGLPEPTVEERLAPAIRRAKDVRIGLLASPRGVTISFTKVVPAPSQGKAESKPLDRLVARARTRLEPHVYAEDADTMEQVVGRALAGRGWMLALAESCTGGLIGHRLTEVPGSSAYLDRGVVSYSNAAKIDLLGVPEGLIRRHGAVSAQVAVAMARGVRLRSGVRVGLSVTGIAGPGGATDRKPVGLVYVGLSGMTSRRGQNGRVQTLSREFRFHGPREAVKLRASQAALDTLRQWLEAQS